MLTPVLTRSVNTTAPRLLINVQFVYRVFVRFNWKLSVLLAGFGYTDSDAFAISSTESSVINSSVVRLHPFASVIVQVLVEFSGRKVSSVSSPFDHDHV